MSEETIDGIRLAIQKHVDSFPGEEEQVVDFITVYASLDEKGGWRYSYTSSGMISPHAAVGLVNMGLEMITDGAVPSSDGEGS